MAGQGLAGILAGVLKIVLLIIFDVDLKTQAYISFCSLGVFNICSALAYPLVFNSDFYKYYANQSEAMKEAERQSAVG